MKVPGTAYYPRSVQTKDGRIFVIGHVGGDDAYGKVDQSTVMDSFRLAQHDSNPKRERGAGQKEQERSDDRGGRPVAPSLTLFEVALFRVSKGNWYWQKASPVP